MRDVISYMINDGRTAVMKFGDSTVRFASLGFDAAITQALAEWAPEVGKIYPLNHNTSVNQNSAGFVHTRRRDNESSKLGLAISLPAAWDGKYFNYTSGWLGPQPALLGRCVTTVAAGTGTGALTVDSTAEFPSSGRIQIGTEMIQYTATTATTFTMSARGTLGGGAAFDHPIGSVVSFISLGNTNCAWNIDNLAGGNVNGEIMQVLFYEPNGATVSTAAFPFSLNTIDNFEQAATLSVTAVDIDATPINTTGTATLGGDYGFHNHGFSGLNLEGKYLVNGCTKWTGGNFTGIKGPGFLRTMATIDKGKATGFLPTFSISQGGKMLSEFLSEFMNTTNHKNALARYFWDYAKIRNADLGGNGNSRLCIFNIWGQNETGGGTGVSSFVDTNYAWTIKSQTTANGAILIGATSITLADATGFNTTAMGGGHVLIGTERIKYTTLTGNVISGCTRGFAGTTAAGYSSGTPVYQGYRPSHPDGIAADLLYFWNIVKTAWTSNPTVGSTFTADQIDFVYVRPLCMSDAPTAVSDDLGIADRHEREYKLQRFAMNISARLTPEIPGFVLLDPSIESTYAERTINNWNTRETDDIHDTYVGYLTPTSRALSRHMRGGGKRSIDL